MIHQVENSHRHPIHPRCQKWDNGSWKEVQNERWKWGYLSSPQQLEVYRGFLSHRGTPVHHPFSRRFFYEIASGKHTKNYGMAPHLPDGYIKYFHLFPWTISNSYWVNHLYQWIMKYLQMSHFAEFANLKPWPSRVLTGFETSQSHRMVINSRYVAVPQRLQLCVFSLVLSYVSHYQVG